MRITSTLLSDIHGFCVPGQQYICLLSPHRTSRDHQQCYHVACRALPCAESGILLHFSGISYNSGFCVSGQQHICLLTAQILEAWLRFANWLGAAHHSSSEPSQPTKIEETEIVLRITSSDIHGFCSPGQQHICLLSPHRTSRNDGSCLAAARVHHTSSHGPASLACRALSCAERGIVLLFAGISYIHGICVPKKQHICALSSERLSSDPSRC